MAKQKIKVTSFNKKRTGQGVRTVKKGGSGATRRKKKA